jgi:hypothetical protein
MSGVKWVQKSSPPIRLQRAIPGVGHRKENELCPAPSTFIVSSGLRLSGSIGRSSFTTGKSHSFGGEYLELVPHERIRYTDKFDDPNLPGLMQATILFKKVSCGTEVNITQEGVPEIIPAEACYLGWQESLALLAKLVEAEIQDEP